jgi:hypothetical protein
MTMDPSVVVLLMLIGGLVAGYSADMKGRSSIFWALAGALTPVVALIVLWLLPARTEEDSTRRAQR